MFEWALGIKLLNNDMYKQLSCITKIQDLQFEDKYNYKENDILKVIKTAILLL